MSIDAENKESSISTSIWSNDRDSSSLERSDDELTCKLSTSIVDSDLTDTIRDSQTSFCGTTTADEAFTEDDNHNRVGMKLSTATDIESKDSAATFIIHPSRVGAGRDSSSSIGNLTLPDEYEDDFFDIGVEDYGYDDDEPRTPQLKPEQKRRTRVLESVEDLNECLPRLFHESLGSKQNEEDSEIEVVKKDDSATRFQISVLSFPVNEEEASSEDELAGKSPKDILYEICSGKWSKKTPVILDSESCGTKKLDCRPCSNANCMKEAEQQKRRKQLYKFKISKDAVVQENDVLFEDGKLPSYHSMLQVWQNRKVKWKESIFRSGGPVNENEFLKMWRECRRNPEAYGIHKTPPRELPNLRREKRPLLRPPPCQPNSSKIYNPASRKQDKKECEKMIKRYEELRQVHPHFEPITGLDAKNKEKIAMKLQQAEDWNRIATYEPPISGNLYSRRTSSGALWRELDIINSNIPRYAAATKSSVRKMRNIVPDF